MKKEFVNPTVRWKEKVRKLRQENHNLSRQLKRLTQKYTEDIEELSMKVYTLEHKTG